MCAELIDMHLIRYYSILNYYYGHLPWYSANLFPKATRVLLEYTLQMDQTKRKPQWDQIVHVINADQ